LLGTAVYTGICKNAVMKKPMKNRNPVAKYCRKYNKAIVMADRKKARKAGYKKHRDFTYE